MIAIASDHGGYPLKEHIKAYLAAKGITCQDFGNNAWSWQVRMTGSCNSRMPIKMRRARSVSTPEKGSSSRKSRPPRARHRARASRRAMPPDSWAGYRSPSPSSSVKASHLCHSPRRCRGSTSVSCCFAVRQGNSRSS